jgi:hypothetical protein
LRARAAFLGKHDPAEAPAMPGFDPTSLLPPGLLIDALEVGPT